MEIYSPLELWGFITTINNMMLGVSIFIMIDNHFFNFILTSIQLILRLYNDVNYNNLNSKYSKSFN